MHEARTFTRATVGGTDEAALDAARDLGYERVRLDTVAELVEAARVYEALGFVEIAPYRHNPLPTARFYEVTLGAAGSR